MMAGSWLTGRRTRPLRRTLAGADVTQKIEQRLISLTLTDNRGFEADQLSIELDDADGQLMMPRRGVELSLALGWKGEALFPKGTYTVDEIEHSGTPDRLILRAQRGLPPDSEHEARKSWHQTSVGEVVKEIAGRHKLKTAIGDDVTKMAVDHIDQTNESDASFLMRLAKQCGAVACIKTATCCLSGRVRAKQRAAKCCPPSPSCAKTATATVLSWLTVTPIPACVIASWLHPASRRKAGNHGEA